MRGRLNDLEDRVDDLEAGITPQDIIITSNDHSVELTKFHPTFDLSVQGLFHIIPDPEYEIRTVVDISSNRISLSQQDDPESGQRTTTNELDLSPKLIRLHSEDGFLINIDDAGYSRTEDSLNKLRRDTALLGTGLTLNAYERTAIGEQLQLAQKCTLQSGILQMEDI
jgi:hypothetical protein